MTRLRQRASTVANLFRRVNRNGKAWGTGLTKRQYGKLSVSMRGKLTLKSLRLTIYVEHARGLCYAAGVRIGTDPVPSWPCLDPNDRALPRLQTADSLCCKRSDRYRAGDLEGSARSGLPTVRTISGIRVLSVIQMSKGPWGYLQPLRVERPQYPGVRALVRLP